MEDYKEKYTKALERAKKYHEGHTLNVNPQSAMEYVFPELKESEDERIRKEIVEYIKIQQRVIKDEGHIQQANDIEEWLVWLEKKCEQKAVSKTEPIVEGLTTEFQKHVSHLIASAMDKEHEYTKGYIEWVAQSLLGYAKNEQTPTNKVEPKFKVGDKIKLAEEPKYPAREIIAIKNDAYCFDKLEQLPFINQDKWELVEQTPADKIKQNPTWNEEDEKMFIGIISIVGDWYNSMSEKEKEYYGDCGYINWFKSLKERVQPNPKQEWSENDERMCKNLLFLMEQENSISSWEGCYEWLESLKERMKGE